MVGFRTCVTCPSNVEPVKAEAFPFSFLLAVPSWNRFVKPVLHRDEVGESNSDEPPFILPKEARGKAKVGGKLGREDGLEHFETDHVGFCFAVCILGVPNGAIFKQLCSFPQHFRPGRNVQCEEVN